MERTVYVGAAIILEPASPVVWFTFPGAWHDIGRFHRADGTFTGLYANILTPVEFADELTWSTTDLFLDIWFPAGESTSVVLDREEFVEAVDRRWITETQQRAAEQEVQRIIEQYQQHAWPPREVTDWTLERARAELRR